MSVAHMSLAQMVVISNAIREEIDELYEIADDMQQFSGSIELTETVEELRGSFDKLRNDLFVKLTGCLEPPCPGVGWEWKRPGSFDIVKSVAGHEVRVYGPQKYPELSAWRGFRWTKIKKGN